MATPGQPWTGELSFQLVDVAWQVIASLHVVLRRDLVTIWLGDRNLAILDRDHVREWATSRSTALERHDVTFNPHGDWTAVRIDGGTPAWITPEDFRRFAAVV